jgi:hypothetical protein
MSTPTRTDQSERAPPRTSTLLASALALVTVGVLARSVTNPLTPAALGVAGILSLAACFELSGRDTSLSRGFLLGLLTIPVGVGFIGGLLGTTVVLVGEQFPVPTSPLISVAILRIFGGLSIVVGCIIAIFGLVLGRQSALDQPSLRTYTKTAFVTASVPVALGLFLFVRVALTGRPNATRSPFGQLLDQAGRVVLAPAPPRLHLGSFLFVLTVTGAALVLFLRQVPVADLLAGRARESTVRRFQRGLQLLVSATAVLFVPAIVLETLVTPAQLAGSLGPGLLGTIQAVTTARFLRLLLVGITVLALSWVAVDTVVRQSLARDHGDGQQWAGPLVAGGLLTVTATLGATRAFAVLLDQTTGRLPSSLGAEVQRRVLAVVSVYGETAFVVLFAGVLVALAGLIGAAVWFAVSVGYLTDEGAGFSLAAGGLFAAAIGAVIDGAPTWLVLGALVASLVVWDIGTFGARLGREVGDGETREVELLHASATLFVGLCAAGAAFAVLELAPAASDPSPTTTLALASLGVGIVALALAVRD